jgi:hypothetical protein
MRFFVRDPNTQSQRQKPGAAGKLGIGGLAELFTKKFSPDQGAYKMTTQQYNHIVSKSFYYATQSRRKVRSDFNHCHL